MARRSPAPPAPDEPITLERLKRGLRTAAYIVCHHPRGEKALPIYERLEREIADRETREQSLARAAAVLDAAQ